MIFVYKHNTHWMTQIIEISALVHLEISALRVHKNNPSSERYTKVNKGCHQYSVREFIYKGLTKITYLT